ncbi:alpha/beta hydrolase family esterase [Litchfieldella xinjiangensis]|uniref:extracellular catalytic domain type 1 short-chain-length polyhydroxyalkanoate depolymerase n=1 Tax=Litchfieldella xinjiangensis TaxID=1166948 RepID=UPI0005BBDA1A
MNSSVLEGLQEATRLTQSGKLNEATAMIQRALGGMSGQASYPDQEESDTNPSGRGTTYEGNYRVVDEEVAAESKKRGPSARSGFDGSNQNANEDKASGQASSGGTADNGRAKHGWKGFGATTDAGVRGAGFQPAWREALQRFRGAEGFSQPLTGGMAEHDHGPGKFIAGTFANQAGTRDYKLYIPSGDHEQPLPLVVMLHGCTQNPDDFAIGTGMNRLAEAQPCYVLYPAQPAAANSSKCWNWFKASDQQRERGEPSIIAGMTRQVLDEHRLDEQRVYVAGLSAGGAMAATLAMTYPELYAAVGVHSGLPHAAAHDLPSAFAAMQGGSGPLASHGKGGAYGSPATAAGVPAIVFHGDRDTTVNPCNGDRVAAQCAPSVNARSDTGETMAEREARGRVDKGHSYTCVTRHDASGAPIQEQWRIHGAGHAWSGGDARGSYTDPKGPDASKEMLRFFLAHPKTAMGADNAK